MQTRGRQRATLPDEFALIARLVAQLPHRRRTILGPGDDCAIVARGASPILLTIDSMVEGVHFNLGWGTPEQLGARALAVNLSDVAAMGGVPTACVVNLAIRPGLTRRYFDRLYGGLRRAARAEAVDIVGGNITSARQMAITIALLGDAPARPLRRDSARAGDEIFVTGTLGDAALGWRILSGELRARSSARRHLVSRYPVPAAIDLSDGLLQDLGHLLKRSGVGAEVDAASIPVSTAYREVAGPDLSLALGGGEDYELLFCIRPGHSPAKLARWLRVPAHRIGAIVRRPGLHLRG